MKLEEQMHVILLVASIHDNIPLEVCAIDRWP